MTVPKDMRRRLDYSFLASVGKEWSDIQTVAVATGAGTQQKLITDAAVATAGGTNVYLMGLQGTLNGAGAITVESNDGTDISGAMTLADEGGFTWPPTGSWYAKSADTQGLALQATVGTFNGLAQILVV